MYVGHIIKNFLKHMGKTILFDLVNHLEQKMFS